MHDVNWLFESIEARADKVKEIRDWIDEQTDWQSDVYSMIYAANKSELHVWFKEEKHAMMCVLRWS